ncbi:MAG: LysR family transcriptional regulator [Epsilonproteobacteria bacterium]|nr:LysR family transcriptional regulator [Campylobacterota bacterium]
MIKNFSRIETFLTVVKGKSFSKASKKLGISQPAVTQQIKLLEDYVGNKLVERKKNGIVLTKAGEEFYRVCLKLERCILNVEKEIIKIMNKELTFIIGASFMIGNYLVPEFLNDLKNAIHNEVLIKVDLSENVLNEVLDKKADLALVESPVFLEGLIYREWMEDELVLFSNSPLPKYVKKEDLYNFRWICREEESHTRRLVAEAFEEVGIECKSFNIVSVVTNPTVVKQTVLKADKNGPPTVSIISKYVIADEVENGTLYMARIKNMKFIRKLYIAYLKERKYDPFVDNVIQYLMSKRKIPLHSHQSH